MVDRQAAAAPECTAVRAPVRRSDSDGRRLAGLYGFVAALHLLGWALVLHHSSRHPVLVGLGVAAYLFGLRHAFDADHIAAVDDTVRYLLQRGQRPLGVGFFFSLGHATVVFVLAIALVLAAGLVGHGLPQMQQAGAVIGAGVSGVFLWLIGLLNLAVLLDLLKLWRRARSGPHSHARVESVLRRRGFMNRLLAPSSRMFVARSWQMYPVGMLFGLGFDSASEIGLLAMTASAAAGDLGSGAVLALPTLFAAGMTAMDTTDGILIIKPYEWAFDDPLRKIFYNLTTTGLSTGVALLIGSVELTQVLIRLLGMHGAAADRIMALDFGMLGYLVVGLFALGWGLSIAVWKLGWIEARAAAGSTLHN